MGILATAPSTTGHKTNDSSSLLESPKVCRQTRSLSTISQGVQMGSVRHKSISPR